MKKITLVFTQRFTTSGGFSCLLSASEFPSSIIILVSPKERPSVFTVVQVSSKKFSWLLFLSLFPSAYLKDIEFYVDSLFFQYFENAIFFLVCIVSHKKSAINFCSLCNVYFPLWYFQEFLFIIGLQEFDYTVSFAMVYIVYSSWGSLKFLDFVCLYFL